MNINELATKFMIKEETFDAVEKVENLTDKTICFQIVNDLHSHALLKAAREGMKEHIVYINAGFSNIINHLIAHECYHIFRFWSVKPDERKVLSVDGIGAKKREAKWKKELGGRGHLYPIQVFETWEKGVTSLLYNAITDTRIELAIYNDYLGLRTEQLQSLKKNEEEAKKSLDKKIERIIPHSLFVEAGAMNYAYLTLLTPILGKSWKRAYKGHSDIAVLGNKLLRVIPENDEGLIQDIELITKWQNILDIEGINWSPFEKIPIGYEYMY